MFALSKLLPLALAACALAPAALADSFGISFGKHSKHGAFALQWSNNSCAPAPVICPPQVWIPAHHETVMQQVWVPAAEERVYVPPLYELRYDHCGHPLQVCVRSGYWTRVCTPAHYESRPVSVYCPGSWQAQHHAY